MLAHDALAVGSVHVAHLDTAGAVAASAVGTTHKQLTGLLGLEQALACGGIELRWDVVGHLYVSTFFARSSPTSSASPRCNDRVLSPWWRAQSPRGRAFYSKT